MQLVFDFPVRERFSFDNFIVCGGNRTAYDFARLVSADPGIHNLLYVHGPSGSGKTHLLASLGSELQTGGNRVRCISFREAADIYAGGISAEAPPRLESLVGGADVLLVDDLDLLPDHAAVRQEFWQVFNDFHDAGKVVAISGRFPPKEMANLDEHLASRLLWGLVARMDVSDDDSRRLIVRKLAEDRQIIVGDDVVEFLLQRTRRDIPSLVEALDFLQKAALSAGRRVSVRLAREVLT